MMNVYYGCYCEAKTDFEPLYFKLANYEFKVSPEIYIAQTYMSSSKKRFCYFLMQGSSIKSGTILLGDSFLRNYYVYHDVTNRKMGFYGDYMLYSKVDTITREMIYVIIGIIAAIALLSVCCLFYCCICRSSGGSENVPLVTRSGLSSESMAPKGN
jgi:hypothetical protein